MKIYSLFLFVLYFPFVFVFQVQAQDNIKALFDQQFQYASRVLDLAEAMPAEKYSWTPGEGVRTVGEVYTHIASSNYFLIKSLGISAPEGVNVETIDTLTEKDDIVQALAESITFVLAAIRDMPDEKLSATVHLFGRELTGEGVLIFILNHMSEHVGQSVAYARMNNVIPPWND